MSVPKFELVNWEYTSVQRNEIVGCRLQFAGCIL